MSRASASWCSDCGNYAAVDDDPESNVCGLGHKPRFYVPQTNAQAYLGVWGWKRRCDDFVLSPLDTISGGAPPDY